MSSGGALNRLRSYLEVVDSVSPVVDVEMIVAVELQRVEPEHESLKDAVCLKGYRAVQISLVLRGQHRTVDFSVKVVHKVMLAHDAHLV